MTAALLEPGAVLHGTYEIVRRTGGGGMGDVYEARHLRLSGRYAVKVLRDGLSRDPAALARFRREAEIASSLRHPNIVAVVDFNVMDEGAPYLVMEFLEGRDLGTELERTGAMPLPRVVDIVEQIAGALAAAHSRGIVHRDLKPQNVFLVPADGPRSEIVKLLDFGISKMVTAQPLTGDGSIMGTPHYMAPEQADGRSRDVDTRTDLFALGAIIYEMITGRRPFTGDSPPAVLLAIASRDPEPVTAHAPDLPPALDPVLRRALARDRRDRFLTATELWEALAAAARGTSVTAGAGADTIVRHRPGSWRRRVWLGAGLVAGGLALLAAGRLRPTAREEGLPTSRGGEPPADEGPPPATAPAAAGVEPETEPASAPQLAPAPAPARRTTPAKSRRARTEGPTPPNVTGPEEKQRHRDEKTDTVRPRRGSFPTGL